MFLYINIRLHRDIWSISLNINEIIFKIILYEILIIMTINSEWIITLDTTTMLQYMIVPRRHIWTQQCSVFTTEYTDNVINKKSRKFVINDIFISQMHWDFFSYEYVKRLDLRKSELQYHNYDEVFFLIILHSMKLVQCTCYRSNCS